MMFSRVTDIFGPGFNQADESTEPPACSRDSNEWQEWSMAP